MGSSMKFKTVLMTGAAALALSANAWAAQGDTYVSLFGGLSTLDDTSLLHYNLDTLDVNRSNQFAPRGTNPRFAVSHASKTITFTSQNPLSTPTSLGNNSTPIITTSGGYTYPKGYYAKSFSRIGTLTTINQLHYEREFEGEVGTQGWVIGAALGVELFQGLRGEVEASFRQFDLDGNAYINHVVYSHTRTRIDRVYTYSAAIHVATGTTTKAYVIYDNGIDEHVKKTTTNTTASFYPAGTIGDYIGIRYQAGFSINNADADMEGDLSAFSIMANLWYDFPLGDTGIVPFVGVGVGISNLTLDYVITQRTPISLTRHRLADADIVSLNPPSFTSTVDDPLYVTRTLGTQLRNDQAVFAYQFGVGLGYEFDNGVMLTGQYRYFATQDGDFGAVNMGVESSDFLAGIVIPLGRDR